MRLEPKLGFPIDPSTSLRIVGPAEESDLELFDDGANEASSDKPQVMAMTATTVDIELTVVRAPVSVICGDGQLAVFSSIDEPPRVSALVAAFFPDADLVVVEGFRAQGLPSVRVHRSAHSDATWCAGTEPVAWVSDVPIPTDVPVLPLDRPDLVADWLVTTFVAGPPVGVANSVIDAS